MTQADQSVTGTESAAIRKSGHASGLPQQVSERHGEQAERSGGNDCEQHLGAAGAAQHRSAVGVVRRLDDEPPGRRGQPLPGEQHGDPACGQGDPVAHRIPCGPSALARTTASTIAARAESAFATRIKSASRPTDDEACRLTVGRAPARAGSSPP